jgi:hypothetical protein
VPDELPADALPLVLRHHAEWTEHEYVDQP